MNRASINHIRILDSIALHKSGISFNKLAEELKGHVSRAVLSKDLKELCNMGYIKSTRDESHRQRIIFRLNEDLALLIEKTKLRLLDRKLSKRRASRIILKYIYLYDDLAKRNGSQFFQDYLKHRIATNLLGLLEMLR